MNSDSTTLSKLNKNDTVEEAQSIIYKLKKLQRSKKKLTDFESFLHHKYQNEIIEQAKPVNSSISIENKKHSESFRRILPEDLDVSKDTSNRSITQLDLNPMYWKHNRLRIQDQSESTVSREPRSSRNGTIDTVVETQTSMNDEKAANVSQQRTISTRKSRIIDILEKADLYAYRHDSVLPITLRENLSKDDRGSANNEKPPLRRRFAPNTTRNDNTKHNENMIIQPNNSERSIKRVSPGALLLPRLDQSLTSRSIKQSSSFLKKFADSSANKLNSTNEGLNLQVQSTKNSESAMRDVTSFWDISSNKQSIRLPESSEHIPSWLKYKPQFLKSLKDSRNYEKHKVSAIFQKLPSQRTSYEKEILINHLSGIDLFSGFSHESVVELCGCLQTLILKQGDRLCKQDDAANCVWIIIEGEVAIYRNGERIGTAKSGELLGRQALDSQSLRAATLEVASREAIIVMLASYDFHRLVAGSTGEIMTQYGTISFLIKIPLFKQLKNYKVQTLATNLRSKKFYKNEVIYRKDDIANELFILYDGNLQKEVSLHIEKVNRWPTDLYQWRERKVEQDIVIRMPVEVGETFGFKEMFFQIPREEKIVAFEESIVYYITRDKILQVLSPEEIEMFMKNHKEQEQLKQEKFKSVYLNHQKSSKKKTDIIKDAHLMYVETHQPKGWMSMKGTKENDWRKYVSAIQLSSLAKEKSKSNVTEKEVFSSTKALIE